MAKKNFNPFYALLVVVGVAFCITAFAFGVMTVRGMMPAEASESSEAGTRLMTWLDQNGFKLMMIELLALAIFTVAAIGTDEYWTKREREKSGPRDD